MAERHPLHGSSSGLVLRAFAPPDYQDAVLAGRLDRLNPDTVTHPDQRRRILVDIRRRHVICAVGMGTPN